MRYLYQAAALSHDERQLLRFRAIDLSSYPLLLLLDNDGYSCFLRVDMCMCWDQPTVTLVIIHSQWADVFQSMAK